MRELYDLLPEKPEWLTEQDLDRYEKEMLEEPQQELEQTGITDANTSPTIRKLYEQYKPMVMDAISEDTAYRNACSHFDRKDAAIEGSAAIRRVILASKDRELIRLYSDVPTFRQRLRREVIDETYPKLHELLRPLSQEAIDPALKEKEILEKPAQEREQGQVEVVNLDDNEPQQPVSVLVDGAWKSFPNQKEAEQAAYEEYKETTHRNAENYHIDREHLSVGGPRMKYQANVNAIKLLHELESTGMQANAEQQEVLSKYIGWGGLADAFDPNKTAWREAHEELQSVLSPEEYASARASVNTAFYTPPLVIRSIYQTLERMGLQEGKVLDPACGTGNFFGMLPPSMRNLQTFGVELDSVSGRIAKQLYPNTTIAIQGYEQTKFADHSFDAIIGNVPFGQFQVNDPRYNKEHFLIHDYFFAKAMDQVRPGGIVAFITSKGTMDKTDPSVRRYLAQRAELLGAVRLPDTTFRADAGTSVTSDILFLQKREAIQLEVHDLWIELSEDSNGIPMNRYFVDHPEMICGHMEMESGPFGMDSVCKPSEQPLEELLEEVTKRIEGHLPFAEPVVEAERGGIPADPNLRPNSLVVMDDVVYYQYDNQPTDTMEVVEPPKRMKNFPDRVRQMAGLRDCVRELLQAQLDNAPDEAITALQANLNQRYDTFSKDYGRINDNQNQRAFSEDSSYYLLCSLEELDENKKFVGKAAIFSTRTIRPHQKITRVESAQDALFASLSENGVVDMDYMEHISGKNQEELLQALTGQLYRNIHCGKTPTEITEEELDLTRYPFVPAEEYLSGNVREKFKMATALYERLPDAEKEKLQGNLVALKKVQPVDLDASEIKGRLGASWIEPRFIDQFVYNLLNTPHGARDSIKTEYVPTIAKWHIANKSLDKFNINVTQTYGTKRMDAYEIIEASLNQKAVKIFDAVELGNGKIKQVLNQAETQVAQGLQKDIETKFEEWIWSYSLTRRNHLTKLYNEKFNSTRLREYNGDFLKLDGINPKISLRPHQKNAVARILYGGNTLLGHVVGAGKTFTMAAAAMECKRLGRCHKPMMVVPNNILASFASDFLKLYPSATLLVTTEKDFAPENRKKFCSSELQQVITMLLSLLTPSLKRFHVLLLWQRKSLSIQSGDLMEGIEAARFRDGKEKLYHKRVRTCAKTVASKAG